MQEQFRKATTFLKRAAAVSVGLAMMGATVTGALALDLAEYPSPFVMGGKYDSSNALVVGANAAASDTLGMVDIATNLQFESKECTPSGGTVNVAGGVTEDIPLGSPIADSNSETLDQELEDDDISNLIDTAINFQSKDYDVKEVVVLNQGSNAVTVATSLTSSEDDYESEIVLEAERDSIKYYYVFDETISVNASTSSDPLEIKFLGQTLKITSVDSSGSKFTANVGAEFFMNVDDSVTVDGKKITLNNVGSGGAIVVDVDGVTETIPSSSTETVNGIEIKNEETFYEDNKDQRSATLIIGKDAVETYNDGDAYVGEDDDDPNWVWNVANLTSEASTTTSTSAEFSGPYIGVENDFVYNDDADNPPKIGECIDLPNNHVSICLDSLTVADSDYATYTIEFENSGDLSESNGGTSLTSEPTIYIHTSVNEGLIIDMSDLSNANVSSDKKTDKVWIHANAGGSDVTTMVANATDLAVYYEDTNSKTQLAGSLGEEGAAQSKSFLEVNYDNTKGTDVQFLLGGYSDLSTDVNFTLVVQPYDSTHLPNYDDDLNITWFLTANKINSLGSTQSSEEANELVYNGTNVGTKDEDHRMKYGIILRDPKSNGASDEVVLEIPRDQVQANIVVKGSTTTTSSSSGEVCTVADITPLTMTHNEVTTPSNYNLILVGGPCANPLVESLNFGVTCDGWDLSEGEGIVKLAENGDKVAMLVAGTEALDTRRAAKVVANHKDYTLSGTEALVKGTTLTDITVE